MAASCDPATRGELHNQTAVEKPAPNSSGSVLVDIIWDWDGVSTKATGCDGPIVSVRVRNNSNVTAWALLPNKKKGNPWMSGGPGTDVTTSNLQALSNAGLVTYKDIGAVDIVFIQPV